MIVPVVLLLFATLAAAVMAYGTHPNWAQYANGLEFILLARRLQWPLAGVSLVLCLVMLGLIIAGRRRAWWLIGLAPVLALFVHRFWSDPAAQFFIVEDPAFVSADEASRFVGDDDWVVGLRFADNDYAYPYASLFTAPVVIHAEHDKRLALFWSAYANRAVALRVDRDVRGADLEVVSTPANALLIYNKRLGQFINGVTGLTPAGEKPAGFREPVPVTKTRWKAWRAAHPETRVLPPMGKTYADAPRGPIRPTFPMKCPPGSLGDPPETRIALVGVHRPVAIRSEQLTATPINLEADGKPVLVFRNPADGMPRAMERRIDDLTPRFRPNADRKRPPAAIFTDADTGAAWDANGVALTGPREIRGKRLTPVPAEEGLYWDVMKCWYPDLTLASP